MAFSKNTCSGISVPETLRNWEMTRVASSEWPPRSKKFSCNSDVLNTKDSRPCLGHGFLGLAAWSNIAGSLVIKNRLRKCLQVDLAIGSQGQLVENYKSGWHHVVGDSFTKKFPQFVGFGRRVGAGHIGDELLVAMAVLPHDDSRCGDAGVLAQ